MRREAKFTLTTMDSAYELFNELEKMGVKECMISSSMTTKDCVPVGSEPSDPGVSVWFVLDNRTYVIACDTYTKVKWNLRAIGVTVASMRTIGRHGATEMMLQALNSFTSLPRVNPDVVDPPQQPPPYWDTPEWKKQQKAAPPPPPPPPPPKSSKGTNTAASDKAAGRPMGKPEQWWQVLGVSRRASMDQIDTAYKKLARQWHPDLGGDASVMQLINGARDFARAERS
jgi:hypothetical protein